MTCTGLRRFNCESPARGGIPVLRMGAAKHGEEGSSRLNKKSFYGTVIVLFKGFFFLRESFSDEG